MSFSSVAMALQGEALKIEGTTGVEEAEIFDVWTMMAVRYAARDATASRVVEAARGVGVLVPSRSVWDSGATLYPFQQRRSHEPDSSDPGGPRVWARGSSGWMPGRHTKR
jgi:hypothetical protein